jgi:hypothetical protein
MIAVLEGFPDAATAFVAEGRVTKKDYQDVLIPKVEDAVRHHKKIRVTTSLAQNTQGSRQGPFGRTSNLGLNISPAGKGSRL